MSRMLPLFPLNLVVFPGEKLNLHIFEPRYRRWCASASSRTSRSVFRPTSTIR
ncbi:hypothetical protein ACFQT0_16325 [Hymenobacter humi]|uniref:Lon N-terminal domain-containing protein n=1 Tax=Hymenobacter humi TaxID=1411620 RepID=A0ABW2U5K6_9BACT